MNEPVYKHYKGGYYQVVTFDLRAFSIYESTHTESKPILKATIEQNLHECSVYLDLENNYFTLLPTNGFSSNMFTDPLVLYHPVGSKLKYWIRTKENFFDSIDKNTKRFRRLMK